jgi:hypothetical protein
MDERSDIDYFIITEANRLWIVRTGLAIFRRLFLFNSHKNFCTNYFVDSEHLEIREQNIFTAIELCTIKAIFGFPTIERFNAANAWTSAFLPNFALRNDALAGKGFFFTGLIEKIFSFKAIDRCNNWLMTQSIRYWKRRYGSDIDPLDFEIAFRSTTGVSRSHPRFFQKKVLTYYAQKIKDFEFKHGIDLGL